MEDAGYHRGLEVLMDALLLSMCDYVLVTVSAVSEFALWVAPKLWSQHLNLQSTDGFRGQSLPEWIRFVPGASSGQYRRALTRVFCDALKYGCSLDRNMALRNVRNARLYSDRHCSKCDRLVRESLLSSIDQNTNENVSRTSKLMM